MSWERHNDPIGFDRQSSPDEGPTRRGRSYDDDNDMNWWQQQDHDEAAADDYCNTHDDKGELL